MEKNKTRKYLKYAIGEIVLVVIGILIALSLNNWNESRKLEQKKEQLILNLIDDFEENIVQLKSSIDYSSSLSEKMNTYFEISYSSDVEVSLDSLKSLAHSFFTSTPFFASLTTYEEAKANGNLNLLKSKVLSKEFTAFLSEYNFFLGIKDMGRDSYFKGPTWELKKSTGSLYTILKLKGKNRFDIKVGNNMDSYIKLIKTPLVTATFEQRHEINRYLNLSLKQLKLISENIVKSLKESKK
tara:strand:- start:222 stop:944 length:723 start_codon:yes stop_codon:yes gene_type:complete